MPLRTLQPVIFIPPDTVSEPLMTYGEGLWRALGEVMAWYRGQLERPIFQALPLVQVLGRYRAADYFQDTQNKVLSELRRLWDVGGDGRTYVCYGLWGEGPYQAEGNVIGSSGDFLVVQSSTSLRLFSAGLPVPPSSKGASAGDPLESDSEITKGVTLIEDHFPGYDATLWWNSRRAQTGALAHELGHTLGLPHTSDAEPARAAESIMYAWWDYPRTAFTARELATVVAAVGGE